MNKNLILTTEDTELKDLFLTGFFSVPSVVSVVNFYNFLYRNKYINTNGELHECID